MRRRVARIVLNLTVELSAGGRVIRAVSQDVTPFGMFIRMRPSGTSHCHPIQRSVNPCSMRRPSPKCASVVGSVEPDADWNVTSIPFPPRFPTS